MARGTWTGSARWVCATVAWWLALAGDHAEPARAYDLTRGPYLQQPTDTSMLVAFEGVPGAADLGLTVNYGVAEPGEATAACACDGGHCECPITGLAADTVYQYQVLEGAEARSALWTFRTAPAGEEAFTFVVFGDNRSDHDAHGAVTAMIEASVPDYAFMVNTGDLVDDGEVETQWDTFFDIEQGLLAQLPIFAAVGNHEVHEEQADIFERVFHGPSEASGSPKRTYYSFQWANAHFVVIDDFLEVAPWFLCALVGKLYDGCLTAEQTDWLEADLAAASADPTIDHVFVFMHEGPYSSKEGRTGSQAIRDLLPLFAESKVRVVFSGHDHYFEHGLSGNGLDYVISGGGGAPLYPITPTFLNQLFPHDVVTNKSAHNYQEVLVQGGFVQVTTWDVDEASVLEVFTLGTPPSCAIAADCEASDATPGACAGGWTCPSNGQCVWECAPGPPCTVATDCPDDTEYAELCGGEWVCPPDGECLWICDPVVQCTSATSCATLSPVTDCVGGHYECPDQVCEWVCPPQAPPEPEPGPEPGPEPAPELSPEPGPGDDADADADSEGAGGADGEVLDEDSDDASDAAQGGGEAPRTAPDSGLPVPAPEEPPIAEPGTTDDAGCSNSSPASPPALALVLAVVALLVARRRRDL